MTASQVQARRLFGPSWMSQMKVVTLTPLSLLIAIITVGLCSVPFSKPEPIPSSLPNWPENWQSWRNGTIWEIAQSPEYLTPITPLKGEFLAAFLGVLVVMQVAYCALFCTKGVDDESRVSDARTMPGQVLISCELGDYDEDSGYILRYGQSWHVSMGRPLGLFLLHSSSHLIVYAGQEIVCYCGPLPSPRPPRYALPKSHASYLLSCFAYRIRYPTYSWTTEVLPRALV